MDYYFNTAVKGKPESIQLLSPLSEQYTAAIEMGFDYIVGFWRAEKPDITRIIVEIEPHSVSLFKRIYYNNKILFTDHSINSLFFDR